jgi:hypothetical protein
MTEFAEPRIIRPADPIQPTVSQRALAAARQAYSLAREAKRRREAGSPAPDGTKGKSTALAASRFGVSPRTVESAKKVLDNGVHDLVRAVEENKISISGAAKMAKEPPEVQRQAGIAVLSGRAKRVAEVAKLCSGGNGNGRSGQFDQTAAPCYDESALANLYSEAFGLLEKLRAAHHEHPGLVEAMQHLVESRRAFELWIRFPSPEEFRRHILGR